MWTSNHSSSWLWKNKLPCFSMNNWGRTSQETQHNCNNYHSSLLLELHLIEAWKVIDKHWTIKRGNHLKGMQISKEDKWNQGEKHMRMRLGLSLNMQFSQVKKQKIWTYYWKPEHHSPLLLLKLQLENIDTYTKCTGYSSLYFAFLPFDTIM